VVNRPSGATLRKRVVSLAGIEPRLDLRRLCAVRSSSPRQVAARSPSDSRLDVNKSTGILEAVPFEGEPISMATQTGELSLSLRGPRRRSGVLLAATVLSAWRGLAQDPCPDPGAALQLILQRESVLWTPELFAAQVQEPEIAVEPGVFELYIGVVSQLPPEGPGIHGWTIYADVTGDLHLIDADVAGTVGAGARDDPPGLVENGFGVADVLEREPFGRFAISSVLFSADRSRALEPAGTATAVRLRIAAEDGARGQVRILRMLEEASGGAGASLLPCCSLAGVGNEFPPFGCVQHLDVTVTDTSRGCATPPEGAGEPLRVAWERRYVFSTATSGGTSIALADDGGLVITGFHSASAAWAIRTEASGEVVWQRFIEREGTATVDLLAVTASRDGGFVLAGEATGFQHDLFLVKLRGDGAVEWDRLIGRPARPETGRAVAAALDGGYIVAGSAESALYLVRTDANGEVVFERTLGIGAGRAVREDPASKAIVIAGERGAQAVILKCDARGEPLWEKTIAPAAQYSAARFGDVLVTEDGYLAAGSFRFARHPGFVERAAVLLAAFGADGTPLEQRLLESRGWVREAHSLGRTPDGGYLVAGLSRLFGSAEFYLVRLDAGRNLLWQQAAGERRLSPTQAALAVTADGGAAVTGTSELFGQRPWMARVVPVETGQLPGDLNQDGRLDLSDGICLLDFLFGTGGPRFLLPCGDGTSRNPANLALTDNNQDGRLDLSDAILIFSHLFLGHRPPALGKECIAIPGCPGICPP
jgi:hypothetical protein